MRYFHGPHAPRCFRHGHPIHAQRRGFAVVNGRTVKQWVCPVCHSVFFRDL
jgi:transposase